MAKRKRTLCVQCNSGFRLLIAPPSCHCSLVTLCYDYTMTLQKAKSILSHYGMTMTHTDGEYAVHPKGDASISYFTNDREDAITTGLKTACKCANNGDYCEACDTRVTLVGGR